ncbi:enoyl-CoA hydratase/isomerase family protein [Williamsia sp.]|uniref:enoyl-CoA hydratase/isomerase family protein n=1 Tax=Williamsia sp. TaxID=1872085 RepID=UPI002F927079
MGDPNPSDRDKGVLTTSVAGGVLRIVIDRPSRRNAMTHAMIDTFVQTLTDAATDDSLRVVHIRGAGGDFCTGADWVATNTTGPRPRAGNLIRRIPHTAHRVIELVAAIHLPVVCTVQGWATGLGCSLALAADFTVADDSAVFWEPFMARGFTPDSGSTWLLPRLMGIARAKEMLLLGEQVPAAQAAEWGMIHRTVDSSEIDTVSAALVDRLAGGPTVAIGLAKAAINFAQGASLTESMNHELSDLELACRTGDFKEGLSAFKERRAPEFDGR